MLPHMYSQNRPAYSQASTSERNEAACASLRSYRTTDAHQGHRLIKKSARLLLLAACYTCVDAESENRLRIIKKSARLLLLAACYTCVDAESENRLRMRWSWTRPGPAVAPSPACVTASFPARW